MKKILNTLKIIAIMAFSSILLSACAKNTAYDNLHDMIKEQKIIGNYYTQDFKNHEVSKLNLKNFAPRQQPRYLNLNFLSDGTIAIDNVDLNFNKEDKIDGRFIVQSGNWEQIKDDLYRLSFKGIYFAEGTFMIEGDYELHENEDNSKELILIKSYKSIKENNGVFGK